MHKENTSCRFVINNPDEVEHAFSGIFNLSEWTLFFLGPICSCFFSTLWEIRIWNATLIKKKWNKNEDIYNSNWPPSVSIKQHVLLMVLIIILQTKYEALLHMNNTHQSEQNDVFFLFFFSCFLHYLHGHSNCLLKNQTKQISNAYLFVSQLMYAKTNFYDAVEILIWLFFYLFLYRFWQAAN